MDKPDVDLIEGLSPAISIEQKATSHNPRSTVGTVTEIYDYLRLLFARIGTPNCITHNIPLSQQTVAQIVDNILKLPENSKIAILSPIVSARKGEYTELFNKIQTIGFTKVRINEVIYDINDTDTLPKLNKTQKHNIEIIIDRIKITHASNTDTNTLKDRITDSVEMALNHGNDKLMVLNLDDNKQIQLYSRKFACPSCNYSIPELEPRDFSFNSPFGACNKCDGLGMIKFLDPNKIIIDPNYSINNGVFKFWNKNNSYAYNILDAVAKYYNFDLDTPFNQLSKEIQNIILYGSKDLIIENNIIQDTQQTKKTINATKLNKITHKDKGPFIGIVNILEQKFKVSNDAYILEELNKYQGYKPCDECLGSRLKKEARYVKIDNYTINELSNLQLKECYNLLKSLHIKGSKQAVAHKIITEINSRLGFLIDVGLDYITLNRSAETLSGGEAQRIRLASQIGSGLTGVMYVLDEPSIGLHQRDNDRLLATLHKLRDLGNTVIVVEHDEDAIRDADYIVDIGPGAGIHGGEVIACGSLEDILKCKRSLTGQFLSGIQQIMPKPQNRKQNFGYLELTNASGNNLKNVNLKIPIANFTCITGVSGSGKSTLINDTLYNAATNHIYGSNNIAAPYDKVIGIEKFDKVINVDQSPIGRTPRSNPATYTGLFTHIRDIFTKTNIAKERGYVVGRFSFNVKGGRCEACSGDGLIKVEMHFLPDIYVVCDVCNGKRYNRETLEVLYKNKNIHEVLEMTVEDALEFFKNIPILCKKLSTLVEVGLSYIKLGQAATTLSGGEAQRVKLALELSKKDTGKTLYILDEPTTGLHFYDINLLLKILHKFVDNGNTVIVIEHNLDVIKTADWIIDLGPEGGNHGGEIIFEGTPKELIKSKKLYLMRETTIEGADDLIKQCKDTDWKNSIIHEHIVYRITDEIQNSNPFP